MRLIFIIALMYVFWGHTTAQNTIPTVFENYSTVINDPFPYPDSSYMSQVLMFDEGYEHPPRPGRIVTSNTTAVKSFNALVEQWDNLTRINPTVYIEEWDEHANLKNQYWLIVNDTNHQIHYVKRHSPTGQYEYLSTNYTARQSWREIGIYDIRHTMWQLGNQSHVALAYNEELKSYGFEFVCRNTLKESIAAPLGLYRVY
jgi:hypothetical protein